MLGIGICFEPRANSAPLAHRFRNSLYRFQPLLIRIKKRQLVQLYVAATPRQAFQPRQTMDQERGPDPRSSDESDLHDGVMPSRTISRCNRRLLRTDFRDRRPPCSLRLPYIQCILGIGRSLSYGW